MFYKNERTGIYLVEAQYGERRGEGNGERRDGEGEGVGESKRLRECGGGKQPLLW